MFPRIRGVRHIKEYKLELAFSDGTVAELDFRRRVVGRGGHRKGDLRDRPGT